MAEIAKFTRHGASHVTPRILRNLVKLLPMLKLEFTQISAPKFPHLVDQLEFLADLVEDFAEGVDPDIPYYTAAEAAFALIYAHNQITIIPDFVPDMGMADDSAIVRAVLIANERVLSAYAMENGFSWEQISTQP